MSDKGLFDEFLWSLVYLTDERKKDRPSREVIDSWWERAETLFHKAVREAVRAELTAVELEVVVKQK